MMLGATGRFLWVTDVTSGRAYLVNADRIEAIIGAIEQPTGRACSALVMSSGNQLMIRETPGEVHQALGELAIHVVGEPDRG